MTEERIKDFYGRTLGFIETKPNGDKICRNFYRQILGRYDKQKNITKDFYGRIVGHGDLLIGLLYKS